MSHDKSSEISVIKAESLFVSSKLRLPDIGIIEFLLPSLWTFLFFFYKFLQSTPLVLRMRFVWGSLKRTLLFKVVENLYT